MVSTLRLFCCVFSVLGCRGESPRQPRTLGDSDNVGVATVESNVTVPAVAHWLPAVGRLHICVAADREIWCRGLRSHSKWHHVARLGQTVRELRCGSGCAALLLDHTIVDIRFQFDGTQRFRNVEIAAADAPGRSRFLLRSDISTCTVTEFGELYCRGIDLQSGRELARWTRVMLPGAVRGVAMSDHQAIAWLVGGGVYAWGLAAPAGRSAVAHSGDFGDLFGSGRLLGNYRAARELYRVPGGAVLVADDRTVCLCSADRAEFLCRVDEGPLTRFALPRGHTCDSVVGRAALGDGSLCVASEASVLCRGLPTNSDAGSLDAWHEVRIPAPTRYLLSSGSTVCAVGEQFSCWISDVVGQEVALTFPADFRK
jgi:hypothetical protein